MRLVVGVAASHALPYLSIPQNLHKKAERMNKASHDQQRALF